jgi:hypothetical protein
LRSLREPQRQDNLKTIKPNRPTPKKPSKMDLLQRMEQPTPRFFRTLRNIGIALTAAGGAIIAAPVALPAALITLAGYVTVAGTVATVVSQSVIKDIDDDPDLDGQAIPPGPNPLLDPNR